jgi:hypothetical protein
MSISEAALLDIDLDNDDHHLTLIDGSIWFVNPRDLPKVARWAPPTVITIDCCVDNSLFPYTLTNKDNDISVLAMKIS